MDEFDFSGERLDEVVEDAQFEVGDKLEIGDAMYERTYYEAGQVRNRVLSCLFEGRPAVLKAVNDPRACASFEGEIMASLSGILQSESEVSLRIPEVFGFKKMDGARGWTIMERFPDKVKNPFDEMNLAEQLKVYPQLYEMYRGRFPKDFPDDYPLALREVNSWKFVEERIDRWADLMKRKSESIGGSYQELAMGSVLTFGEKIIKPAIKMRIAEMGMVFCHGHFKPDEILTENKKDWWLIDFANCQNYFPTYEPAFFIWSQAIMRGDYTDGYVKWRDLVLQWRDTFEKVIHIEDAKTKLNVGLLERLIGTLYADIWGSGTELLKEKKVMSSYCMKLAQELVAEL